MIQGKKKEAAHRKALIARCVCLVEVSEAQDRSTRVKGKRYPGKQGWSVWLEGCFCQFPLKAMKRSPVHSGAHPVYKWGEGEQRHEWLSELLTLWPLYIFWSISSISVADNECLKIWTVCWAKWLNTVLWVVGNVINKNFVSLSRNVSKTQFWKKFTSVIFYPLLTIFLADRIIYSFLEVLERLIVHSDCIWNTSIISNI